MSHDVIVVGGGPAGLAVATHAARRGLSTLVLERGTVPVDKACGEGLMPSGVRELERLGARGLLSEADASPIGGIRYLQEDGTRVEGRLAAPGGLGIRRVALAEALHTVARGAGVEVRERCRVGRMEHRGELRVLHTATGPLEAKMVIAADGLHSGLRSEAGLDGARDRLSRRYGVRRHFAIAPWTDFVEVHFVEGIEAYATPAGRGRLGVAFLFERQGEAQPRSFPTSFEGFLSRFPVLEARLAGAPHDSSVRGAGPLEREIRGRVKERFALLGDAAGYVDAITGEGLSLALQSAAILGELLPEVLARNGTVASLRRYDREAQRHYRRYALFTHALLALARRAPVRARLIRWIARSPRVFEALVRWVVR